MSVDNILFCGVLAALKSHFCLVQPLIYPSIKSCCEECRVCSAGLTNGSTACHFVNTACCFYYTDSIEQMSTVDSESGGTTVVGGADHAAESSVGSTSFEMFRNRSVL